LLREIFQACRAACRGGQGALGRPVVPRCRGCGGVVQGEAARPGHRGGRRQPHARSPYHRSGYHRPGTPARGTAQELPPPQARRCGTSAFSAIPVAASAQAWSCTSTAGSASKQSRPSRARSAASSAVRTGDRGASAKLGLRRPRVVLGDQRDRSPFRRPSASSTEGRAAPPARRAGPGQHPAVPAQPSAIASGR